MVEWLEERKPGEFLTAEEEARYGGRFRFFDVRTAYVDPERGCIPLRMDWTQRWMFGGRTILQTPAFSTLSNVEIEQVVPGVWYPRSSSMTVYVAENQENVPRVNPDDIVEGKPPQAGPAALYLTTDWKVHNVQAQIELSKDFFALPLPQGTLVMDRTANRLFAVGDRSAVLNQMLAAPGMVGDNSAINRRFVWLIGANVLLLALVVVAWKIGKRRRKSRAPEQSD